MTDLIKRDPFFRSLATWPRWIEDFDESAQKGLRIKETDSDILVEAVVAGVPSSEVEVNIEDGVLTIKAEKKEESKDTKSYYRYYYTAALSGGQWDKAKAEIADGVVEVTIPKAEAARPQKISVKPKGKQAK